MFLCWVFVLKLESGGCASDRGTGDTWKTGDMGVKGETGDTWKKGDTGVTGPTVSRHDSTEIKPKCVGSVQLKVLSSAKYQTHS